MKKEVGDMKYQNKLIDMFDQRKLEISYDIFVGYFEDQNFIPSLFSDEDYLINDVGDLNSITIKN
jgi:hypothetical protein